MTSYTVPPVKKSPLHHWWEGLLPGSKTIAFATDIILTCCPAHAVTNMPDTIARVGFFFNKETEYIYLILKGLEYLLVGV